MSRKKEWQGDEWLVCTRCGYRQGDVGTVLMYKRRYPGVPANGIPYVCEDCKRSTNDEGA